MQEGCAFPSSKTIQLPHSAIPQPYFGPFSCRLLRKAYSNGVSGSMVTDEGLPLTFSTMVCSMVKHFMKKCRLPPILTSKARSRSGPFVATTMPFVTRPARSRPDYLIEIVFPLRLKPLKQPTTFSPEMVLCNETGVAKGPPLLRALLKLSQKLYTLRSTLDIK